MASKKKAAPSTTIALTVNGAGSVMAKPTKVAPGTTLDWEAGGNPWAVEFVPEKGPQTSHDGNGPFADKHTVQHNGHGPGTIRGASGNAKMRFHYIAAVYDTQTQRVCIGDPEVIVDPEAPSGQG